MSYFIDWSQKFNNEKLTFITRGSFLDKLSGSQELRLMLNKDLTAEQIKKVWKNDLVKYQKMRKQYLLYKDSNFILEHY